MKRQYTYLCLVLFALILVCPVLRSQDLFTGAEGERIQVCTDRTIYVSGEKVLFSVVIFNVKNIRVEEFSRIFYCELITPGGKKIAGGKYLLQNSSGQGCLTIPEETISGIYYLKCYTRFMRNAGTDEYKYIMLKVINPFKTEVLPGKDVSDTFHPQEKQSEIPVGDSSLNILSGKKTFSPREEIHLSIKGNTGKGLPARICLSVIPENTYEDPFLQEKNEPDTAKSEVYLPETRSISLSGQLIGKESGKPVPDARVNLSIIGDKDILVIRTDSSGRFFFALPDYHVNKDLFLSAGELRDITPEILIDNDFCSRPVYLPSPFFKLNEEEMKAAYKLAVNSRITSMFRDDTIASNPPAEEPVDSFYGEPSEVLVMDKYVELPTLEEYFAELSGTVKLRKIKGRKQFRIYGNETGNETDTEMSNHAPLMLVDWVAVDDIKKILAMSPSEIERIELVNSPYVKGNITYWGIISFVSKKNDFAGIDLPKSGTFVNYSFLEECTGNLPLSISTRNIPDSRNTVYWNPAVQMNQDGTAGISFTAPDTPGKYYILLRGMSKTGKVVLSEEMFTVKKE